MSFSAVWPVAAAKAARAGRVEDPAAPAVAEMEGAVARGADRVGPVVEGPEDWELPDPLAAPEVAAKVAWVDPAEEQAEPAAADSVNKGLPQA